MPVTIIDVTSKTTPVVKSFIQGQGSPNYLYNPGSIAVSGNYAYVASSLDDSITVLDISVPTLPVYSNKLSGAGAPNYLNGVSDLMIVGNYLYAVSIHDDALVIVDITTPTAITLKGEIHGSGAPNYLNTAWKLYVAGDFAYVISQEGAFSTDYSLTIINVSDPAAPTFVSHYIGDQGVGSDFEEAKDIFVVGDYAFIIDGEDNKLVILDVTDRANPVFKSTISSIYITLPRAIDIAGNYAYLACYVEDSLSIMDITDLDNPVFHSYLQGANSPNYLDAADSVFVSGSYAYVTAYFNNSLVIVDISSPAIPTLSGVIRDKANALYRPSKVVVSGNYAYVTMAAEFTLSVVTTEAVTGISGTTATGNGNITTLGDVTPTQHGHCWNTTGTPTTTDSKTENGAPSATGAFTSSITGLVVGTLYYVRAYVRSAADVVYGSEVLLFAGSAILYLFEYYKTNDDTAVEVTGVTDYLQSQTFTPLITHDVYVVRLKLYRVGDPGTVTIAIKATSNGVPTGEDLVSGTFLASIVTTDTAGAWVAVLFNSAYGLTASTVYSIVVKCSASDASNKLYWRQDATAPTYSGGSAVYKNGGWSADTTKDFMFEELGLPVSPDTEEEDQSGWDDVGW